MSKTVELARHLETLHINNMYKNDFYWTWDKTDEEIDAVFTVADALRDLRERNKNTKVFNSGLGISIFRDNSTRTRFSFASACNLLGLEEQVLDEKVSQIAHGETVRETANMVSFMADVIGIRDDMFIGEGHKYQTTFMDAVKEGYRDGILEQQPTLVNLQCDVDHPTQCMADMLHVIHYFGGVENLKGKKVAMTWAYSPSYGKPLSVPQGVHPDGGKPPDVRVIHDQLPGHHGDVPGAGNVPLRRKAGAVDEMGVLHPQLPGPVVHPLHKQLRDPRRLFRQGHGGVVAAGHAHPLQQVLHRDALPLG